MTSPSPSPQDRGKRRSRRLLAIVVAIVLIAMAGLALLIWYIFFRPAGPPPIGPGAPVIPEASATGLISTLITIA